MSFHGARDGQGDEAWRTRGCDVWGYAGGMQMMRHFWDAAVAISPNDAKLDQAERFSLC
jgi:hypothetical protein